MLSIEVTAGIAEPNWMVCSKQRFVYVLISLIGTTLAPFDSEGGDKYRKALGGHNACPSTCELCA
jgi:hypothetical protein